ncbi:MAG: deoxyribose-phosphate aldolase [Anaerolineae bacterium]|nr:deoxyribose-phosphate aldolase [Anaerolineae bacterium]
MDPRAHLEHTLLGANATIGEVERTCTEALSLSLFAVCVAPCWVADAVRILSGSDVKVVTVAGFPFGTATTATKVAEASESLSLRASEVDMVLNLGLFLSGREGRAAEDMEAVAEACHRAGGRLKVILETGYLTDEQKRRACALAVEAGADFVKTSTGFGPGGATVEDVALLRQSVPATVGVKAAGGIRDLKTALAMIAAGASRIGTSAGAAIAREAVGILGGETSE